jgi:general secretion pathway protein M
MLVVAAGIVLAAVLLFMLAVDPLIERLDLLDRQVAGKERAIRELAIVGADYSIAKTRHARLDDRVAAGQGKFSLLSYLEESAAGAQLRDHIAAMQPQTASSVEGYRETSVELRLEGVGFPQLLMLLSKLEESPYLLRVKRLQMKPRFDAPQVSDVTLLVSTYDKE